MKQDLLFLTSWTNNNKHIVVENIYLVLKRGFIVFKSKENITNLLMGPDEGVYRFTLQNLGILYTNICIGMKEENPNLLISKFLLNNRST